MSDSAAKGTDDEARRTPAADEAPEAPDAAELTPPSERAGAPAGYLDAVGFVVIGRNEGERLVRALRSIERLWPSAPVVYVDSGSTDASVSAARATGATVVELDLTRPTTAGRARNAGFARLLEEHPHVRFVQFLDGDCELRAGWIEAAVTELVSSEAVAIVSGRRAERRPESSLFSRLLDIEWNTPVGEARAVLGDMCVTVEAFARVGGFKEHIIAAEDDDLCLRIRHAGFKILRLDAPMSLHEANIQSLGAWFRRARRAGHAYSQVHHEHRHGPERPFRKQLMSAALYGGVAPLAAALAPPLALPVGLLFGAAVTRAARRRVRLGDPAGLALAHALSLYTSKVPELVGALEFHKNRVLAREHQIIEYKAPARGASREARPGALARPRKLRVGLVGAGYIAAFHARAALRDADAELVAVCDLNEAAARRIAHLREGATVYTDYDRMLREMRLDVVHVLTQPDSHFPLAERALEAGCHVVLEKPVTDTSARAAALQELARRHRRVVTVDHNFTFARPVRALRRALDRGDLGPLRSIHVAWKKPLPQMVSGPWDLWMFRDPAHALLETGTHPVSVVMALAGELEILGVEARRPKVLPTGALFHREIEITARAGRVDVRIEIRSGRGFARHFVEAEGLFGVARADLEDDVFTLERSTGASPDGDRLERNVRLGASRMVQAARTYASYGASKFSRRPTGSPYESSLLRGVESCYAAIRGERASRESSLEFALAVTRTVESIAEKLPPSAAPTPLASPAPRRAPMTDAKILVVGASGFLGKHLLAALESDPRGVRALARNPSSLVDVPLGPRSEIIAGDFRDPGLMQDALDGIEVVYHLAVSHGSSFDEYLRSDSEPTVRFARRCLRHGVRRFIYVGTIDSLDLASPRRLSERDGLDPQLERRNSYARSKGVTERRLRELHEREGLPLVVVRPAIVVGAGGPVNHPGVGRWSDLGRCEFWGDGENLLPLVLASDVAAALVAAGLAEGIEGRAYNLSAEARLSARDYVQAVSETLGQRIAAAPSSSSRRYAGDLARWAVKVLARHPDMQRIPSLHDWRCREQRARFDTRAARADLGWRPIEAREQLIELGIRAPTRAFLED